MTAVATKPAKKVVTRKPRKAVAKLPTVIDNEPVVYGCELPPGGVVKLVTKGDGIRDENGVGHVPMQARIVGQTKAALQNISLWVHPNGTMYDAYSAIDPISGQREEQPYCTGHCSWASYFMHSSIQKLETEGWAHVSCGSIMIRRKLMTRRQQDALEMWAICNGHRGENPLDKAIQDLEHYYEPGGYRFQG